MTVPVNTSFRECDSSYLFIRGCVDVMLVFICVGARVTAYGLPKHATGFNYNIRDVVG